jgi:hypothetical protein
MSLTCIAAIVGCGGGSGGSASLGSNSTAAYSGPIAGLGSIVVNGVRFETVGVGVEDSDDIYGTQTFKNSLSLGMTVALAGSVDETSKTGSPSKIRVVGGVRGKVSATTATSISTLNGQTVLVDTSTVYAGLRSTLASLAVNDYVEIYGVTQSNGDFLATRVVSSASITAPNKLAIRGTIDSIPSANRYVVRTSSTTTVTVACDSAATPACLIKPSGVTLVATTSTVAGTPVRVIAADTTSLSAGVLTAVKIQSLSQDQLTNFTGVTPAYTKIKGYTSLVGTDWYVGSTKVTGLTFTAGQFVEVKGTMVNGVLQATTVETESNRTVNNVPYKNELYGAVSAKSGNTFTVQGVSVDASTATFTGGTLAALANGNYVEIKGTVSNGVLTAITVDIKSSTSPSSNTIFANAQFEVYGTVSGWTNASAAFTLTTLNASSVVYNAIASNANISGTVANGSVVEVKGYLDNNQQLVISKVEVKDSTFRE